MKKFQKILTMGLAAMMAVSAMSISALADDTIVDTSASRYEVRYENDCTIISAIISPGETLMPSELDTILLVDRVWPDQTSIGTTTTTRSFSCYASDGNRLNVWVRNNGGYDVKATLTLPSGSSNIGNVGPGVGGYTFGITQSGGVSDTYTLRVADIRGAGYEHNVTTRARQYWD